LLPAPAFTVGGATSASRRVGYANTKENISACMCYRGSALYLLMGPVIPLY